jgi:uncharacterized alkaline shock family protein YloU
MSNVAAAQDETQPEPQPEPQDEPQPEQNGEPAGERLAESPGRQGGSPDTQPAAVAPRRSGRAAAPAPGTETAPSPGDGGPTENEFKGRITVEDEVVEKVAALAALEIPGVADLGGDFERVLESVRDRVGIGQKRATQGVQAKVQEGQVSVDVTIVVEYGHVVMEVATEVRNNVARSLSQLLGMRVVEVNVNVNVDDVQLPGQGRPHTANTAGS